MRVTYQYGQELPCTGRYLGAMQAKAEDSVLFLQSMRCRIEIMTFFPALRYAKYWLKHVAMKNSALAGTNIRTF